MVAFVVDLFCGIKECSNAVMSNTSGLAILVFLQLWSGK